MMNGETNRRGFIAGLGAFGLTTALPGLGSAQAVSAFMQGVAEAAAGDTEIAAFYQSTNYAGIWTGQGGRDARRREVFLRALSDAPAHGLPVGAFDPTARGVDLRAVRTGRELGRAEVAMTRAFLDFARALQTGVIAPGGADDGLVLTVPHRDRGETLRAFAAASPGAFIATLPPQSPEYARLMRARFEMERIAAQGGWGPTIRAQAVKPGQSGAGVTALRDRLIEMGYLRRTARAEYADAMTQAVARFQADHGLETDGVAGAGTLAMLNLSAEEKLAKLLVALERERWMNMPLGARHVWVNIPDFHAAIVDDGRTTFRTRCVVGKDVPDRRTPEFSEVMEHMVVNPTWNVPKSIATKEYLPLLKRNPYAVPHLDIIDRTGRKVNPGLVRWHMLSESYFPFDMREPPSQGNALGLVKFMFPNRWNIYLHDTPAKSLFGRQKRDFSHGCIRLADPFDFAYTLLARQTGDPQGAFQKTLSTGRETFVDLEENLPVHITYRTAFTRPKGPTQFRGDVYGRDARVWAALERAGVALRTMES